MITAEPVIEKSDVKSFPNPKPRRMLQRTTVAVIVIIALVYSISTYVAWQLMHPARRTVEITPLAVGLQYENIEFVSRRDKLRLQGWLVKAQGNRQTVIFAHGYGRNRLQDDVPLLPIVQTLVKDGINAIMFDFRNSGESDGNLTTVGQYEVDDLLGAIDFVHSRPELNQTITLFGFSMGASTAILAGAREPTIAAVIADSPFADLKSYLEKSLSVWSGLPKLPFNQTILSVIPMMVDFQPETASPLREVNKLSGRPLLLLHGEDDRDIPIENSVLLQKEYCAAQLVRIAGATHVGSFATDKTNYFKTVTEFLARNK